MLPLLLSDEEVQQLQSIANSRSYPHSLLTVGKWRKRYRVLGLEGLHDELRSGRPRTYQDDQVAEVINRALQTRPTDRSTHWSARPLAFATAISKSTVHRWVQTFSVQSNRQKSHRFAEAFRYKLSTDTFFVEKVRDIVGFYLNPPENAVVLCVNEKTQIQALDRTQPLLPMGLIYAKGIIHDYISYATMQLFAALDVATGAEIAERKPRHRQPLARKASPKRKPHLGIKGELQG
jgi:putative transposase